MSFPCPSLKVNSILTIYAVGNSTYNSDLGIFLRSGHFPLLIDDAGIGCQFLTGSSINS